MRADFELTGPQSKLPAYPFLDGLRGLAAVNVVCFHLYTSYKMPLPAVDRYAFGWMQFFGHEAVDLFIVLSGFCLALPILAGKAFTPRQFFRRRAKRILPPYYAAVGLFLLASLLAPDRVRENFSSLNILSHLTLTHSWFPRWQIAMAGPFWSVAVEAQIYVVFALLLVPLWRRTSVRIVVLAAWAVGLVPLAMFKADALMYACPWYLGLFAMGLWAAEVSFGPAQLPTGRSAMSSAIIAIAGLSLCVFVAVNGGFAMHFLVLNDVLWGAGISTLLVALAKIARRRASVGEKMPILESRFAVWLGSISYTLYLQHTLILMKLRPIVEAMHLSVGVELAVMIAFGVPVTIGIAWALWWLVERPSLNWARRLKDVERFCVEATSTAPVARAA